MLKHTVPYPGLSSLKSLTAFLAPGLILRIAAKVGSHPTSAGSLGKPLVAAALVFRCWWGLQDFAFPDDEKRGVLPG